MDYVWNIEGGDNILAKAREMIENAENQVHIGLLPETLPNLRVSLERAAQRGVEVIVNTTAPVQLDGAGSWSPRWCSTTSANWAPKA